MRHLSSLPDPGPPSRCVFQDRHQSHRGRRIKTLFPSRPSCTAKTISMYAVFKLRHASENSYLTSDTTEEKERVSNHLEAHQRYYGWLQSIKEMFSCQHGQTLFGGMGGGGVFSIRTSKGNAELQTGSVFVYPTQAHSGSTPLRTANAQTDANHMTGHAELQRAPPETVCVYVCVTVNMCVVQLLCGKTKCVIQ